MIANLTTLKDQVVQFIRTAERTYYCLPLESYSTTEQSQTTETNSATERHKHSRNPVEQIVQREMQLFQHNYSGAQPADVI